MPTILRLSDGVRLPIAAVYEDVRDSHRSVHVLVGPPVPPQTGLFDPAGEPWGAGSLGDWSDVDVTDPDRAWSRRAAQAVVRFVATGGPEIVYQSGLVRRLLDPAVVLDRVFPV